MVMYFRGAPFSNAFPPCLLRFSSFLSSVLGTESIDQFTMLGPGSASPEPTTDEKFAVVISLARDHHDQLHMSLVYCLKIVCNFQSGESARVMGNPFCLHDEDDSYIWSNSELRRKELDVGSIISYRNHKLSKSECYSGGTEKKLESNEVLSLLCFNRSDQGYSDGGVVYHGFKEAYPNAEISEYDKGVYLEAKTRPSLPYVLIAICMAYIVDGKIVIVTRLREIVRLSNRTLTHTPNSIKPITLKVQGLLTREGVGGVVLVGFEPNSTCGCPQAVCEGILFSTAEENQKLPSYEMKRSPHGQCLILSNETFHDESHNRDGAKVDEKALKELFQEFGFIVNIRKDLTRDEMYKVVKDVAAEDHSNYDAFVLIIMSHGGDRDAVCGVDNRPAYVEDIMSEFRAMNCRTLRNKPKLFFVQCCRGSSSEFLSPADRHCDPVPRLHHDSTLARSACPQEADFLLAFGATPGYYSYRYPTGSVFIQVLVDVIKKHHHHSHLVEMLAEVAREVVERGMAANEKIPRVQVPAYSNTLRAKLYL